MKTTFRLFISSTFDDFKLERAVLQKFVFSRIKEWLIENQINISFLPIDLRWGVPLEAQEDQRTMQICLNEVNRSSKELHPDFLVLIGDRYGWIPLPEKIKQGTFKEIEKFIVNKEYFCKWYQLDENEIPSSYILQPVYEIIKNKTRQERLSIWYKEANIISKDIHSILDKTNLTQGEKEKYHLSATHQEYLFYKKISRYNKLYLENNVIGYIRNIQSSKFKKEDLIKTIFFEELKGKELKNFHNFHNEISSFIYSNQQDIEDYIITKLSEEDIQHIRYEKLPKYLKSFALFVEETIKKRITQELQRKKEKSSLQELYKQKILKDTLINNILIGREKDIEKIKQLLKENNQIIISSESGIGKSTIIAKLIDELKNKNIDLIYRFCGIGNIRSTTSLLKDILLNEFGNKLDKEFKEILIKKEDIISQLNQENIKQLSDKIKYKFLELTKDKFIIFDGIDQLEDTEDNLIWLPNRFIISVLNDKNYEKDTKYYRLLKTFPEIKDYKLPTIQDKEDIKAILIQRLKRYNRTITDNQLNYILDKAESNKPLYITIATQELKTWKDDKNNKNYNPYKENSKVKLSATQKGIIKEFIQNLYQVHKNDELLVKRTFGYIYASQNHIDEELLLEILSNDKEVMKSVENKFHKNISNKLPDAVWARLRGDIVNFLKEDSKGNIHFFHREFKNACKMFYDKKTGKKLLNTLETLPTSPKVLEAHASTLAFLKLYYKDTKINFEWFSNIQHKSIRDYYISFLFEESNFLYDKSKIYEAKSYYETINEILKYLFKEKAISWIVPYFRNMKNLYNLNIQIGSIKQAYEFLDEAYNLVNFLYKQNSSFWAEDYTLILNDKGNFYRNTNKLDQAEKYYEKSLKAIEDIHKQNQQELKKTYVITLNNLGNLYTKKYNTKLKAMNLLTKALEFSRKEYKLNSYLWAEDYFFTLNNIGNFYRYLNKFNEAIKFYQESLKIAEKEYQYNPHKWKKNYILSLNNLGAIYSLFQEYDKQIFAEKLLEKALKILEIEYRKYPDFWAEDYVRSLMNLFFLFEKFNKLKEAKKLHIEISNIIKKFPTKNFFRE